MFRASKEDFINMSAGQFSAILPEPYKLVRGSMGYELRYGEDYKPVKTGAYLFIVAYCHRMGLIKYE